MKLARVIRTGKIWFYDDSYSMIDIPPIGTVVQFKHYRDSQVYGVYFPGVRGYAFIGDSEFPTYFEDLDSETTVLHDSCAS